MVLGFDPGYATTGWGALARVAGGIAVSGYGTIETLAGQPMEQRLWQLWQDAQRLIAEYRPECCVVEKLFFSRNQKTAVGVYQARGVLLALIGQAGLPVLELSPQEIKQSLTGSGRAGKKDVLRMVERLLGVQPQKDDAADALAAAMAGLQWQTWQKAQKRTTL